MVSKDAVFAADIGGSKILCGFVSRDGGVIDTEKRLLENDITTARLEEHILSCFNALKKRNPDVTASACGVTIPGVADPNSGTWIYACFSGISNYPVSERLSMLLGLPVTIENDANANAWGEKIFGNCKDCDDFLWVTVSNGVGGGLVLGGELYRGFRMGGGEIGHLVVENESPLRCPCGHMGCMEAMAAGPGISARYEKKTGIRTDARDVAERAENGEEAAREVMRMTAVYIGRGLGRAASILNLEKYVLGGGVMQSFEFMKEDIVRAFREEAFARPNGEAEIVCTALGYEAGLMSAAALAIRPPRKGTEK